MPANLGKRICLQFAAVPRDAIPQHVERAIGRNSFWRGRSTGGSGIACACGATPFCAAVKRVLLRLVIHQLILLVISGEEPYFESMRSHNLGEIVFKDKELLVVVPRCLSPEIVASRSISTDSTPESWITDLSSLKFGCKAKEGRRVAVDRVIQTRVGARTIDGDPI